MLKNIPGCCLISCCYQKWNIAHAQWERLELYQFYDVRIKESAVLAQQSVLQAWA